MMSQWKKLVSLFLLLIFSSHSALQAACPCCTLHAIVVALRSVKLQTEPTCCQQHSASKNQQNTSCCQTKNPLKNEHKKGTATPPCRDVSDCECCVPKPSFRTSGTPLEKYSIAFDTLAFELPSSEAIRNVTFDIPRVAPLPLQRRLALIAFWRN